MNELRDCFDILPDRRAIRLKGTRIDWEHIVQLFQNGIAPDAIATHFACPLSLEQVYAAVTYYMLNKREYEEYVRCGDEIAKRLRDEYLASLTPEQQERQMMLRTRLRDLKAKFTDDHGRLNLAALNLYVAEQKSVPAGAGA